MCKLLAILINKLKVLDVTIVIAVLGFIGIVGSMAVIVFV